MLASLINLLGFTTGSILYAMLLWMVLWSHSSDRQRFRFLPRSDRLLLLTGVLGLLWNIGAFWAYGLFTLGLLGPFPLLLAIALSALGFLPAVVVHSVLRSRGMSGRHTDRAILIFAYALSFTGSVLHLVDAAVWGVAPSQTALLVLTAGFGAVMLALLLRSPRRSGWGRALWVVALAVFAVSALHLSNHQGTDPWWLELAGHHASLPLALAFLHQDYRFALADIFLKRAVALVLLVGLVFGFYVIGLTHVSGAGSGVGDQRTILIVLAMWVTTALVYPWIRSVSVWFVDKVVLHRPDYDMLLAEASRAVGRHEDVHSILNDVKQLLGPALSARTVTWQEIDMAGSQPAQKFVVVTAGRSATALIPTVEAPHYLLSIGDLEAGRRLLSDDTVVIERLAVLVARRIDTVRTAQERFERSVREREMSRLAAEAELRALRSQIHPHFLFNALTTIGYLIQTSPEKAVATLMRLSGLLRTVLRSVPEFSPLGDELKIVQAYLEIERARFEERLTVIIDVPDELRRLRVPTLLIQPLVENAVKHGISKSAPGGEVRVSANLITDADGERDEMLRLVVEDTGAGADELQFASGRKNGVGLNNVSKRLECYGNGKTRMQITSRPGFGTRVEMVLPADKSAEAGKPKETSVCL
jgi:hypothetical protein